LTIGFTHINKEELSQFLVAGDKKNKKIKIGDENFCHIKDSRSLCVLRTYVSLID
jgi:hypothetical protein